MKTCNLMKDCSRKALDFVKKDLEETKKLYFIHFHLNIMLVNEFISVMKYDFNSYIFRKCIYTVR